MTTTATTVTPTPDIKLAEWERQLAALPDSADVPATYNAQAEHARRHSWLTGHIQTVRESQRVLAEVEPQIATLAKWQADLESCRQACADEYLALPSPIRTSEDRGRECNLRLSIQVCDRALGVAEGSGFALETLRLGHLLREKGYVDAPPTEGRAIGTLPWFGALPEVDRRVRDLHARRDDAQTRLDAALRDSL
jgi:hypothetical protein